MTAAPTPATASLPTVVGVVGVALLSRDADALAAFYAEVLGIALERRVHPDGRIHHVGDVAGVHFEVKATHVAGEATADSAGGEGVASTIEVSLEVTDVDATFERALARGARAHARPGDFTWGRFGVVVDPDGNRVGLYARPVFGASDIAAHDGSDA